ncbi:GD16962 [Drosophila simulans]|uniref:GD16962 n=1 Tax=Drosophila simulans TaxID=7240 RepID=B4R760_DROSI|nr:GD16962 [Drosophila simulans]
MRKPSQIKNRHSNRLPLTPPPPPPPPPPHPHSHIYNPQSSSSSTSSSFGCGCSALGYCTLGWSGFKIPAQGCHNKSRATEKGRMMMMLAGKEEKEAKLRRE